MTHKKNENIVCLTNCTTFFLAHFWLLFSYCAFVYIEFFKQTLRMDNVEYELGAMFVLSSGIEYEMSLHLI